MKNEKGFTLIEVLAAMAIFSIIIVLVMDVFLHSFYSQKRILQMQDVQREGGYLMEILSREIRMATAISDQSVSVNYRNNDSSLVFTNHEGVEVEYCRSDENGVCSDDDSGDFFAYGDPDVEQKFVINSSDVTVNYLKFYVSPEDAVNHDQPIITVIMQIASKNNPGVVIDLQSSISTRLYNF